RLARLLREALGRLLPARPRPSLPPRGVAARPVARRRRLRPRLARPARRDLRVLEAADGYLAALPLAPRRHVSGAARRSVARLPHLPRPAPARLGARHDALRQRALPRRARARPQARRHGRAPARRPLPHGRARLGALRLLRLLPPPAQLPLERLPEGPRPEDRGRAGHRYLRRARLRGVALAAAVRPRARDAPADGLRKLRALQRHSRRLPARPLPARARPRVEAPEGLRPARLPSGPRAGAPLEAHGAGPGDAAEARRPGRGQPGPRGALQGRHGTVRRGETRGGRALLPHRGHRLP